MARLNIMERSHLAAFAAKCSLEARQLRGHIRAGGLTPSEHVMAATRLEEYEELRDRAQELCKLADPTRFRPILIGGRRYD